jgi:hypothetical protein
MLPILRVLPVGGVLLALLILVLALKAPGVRPLPPDMIEARGPLVDRHEHPEWRQISTQAALRRAAELNQLRDLPDSPPRMDGTDALPVPAATATSPETSVATGTTRPADKTAGDEPQIAGLPGPGNITPDDDIVTGSVEESTATMPVEIGEASAFELPVLPPEERPPVILTPEKAKPPTESQRKPTRRKTRAKAAAPPQTPPNSLLSFLEMLFKGSAPSDIVNQNPGTPQ